VSPPPTGPALPREVGTTRPPGRGRKNANYVGTAHPEGVAFWARFADALRNAGYDGPLSSENEDDTLDQRQSVAFAVDTLRKAFERNHLVTHYR
jgi:sugar phosphate isomerase/epimerase